MQTFKKAERLNGKKKIELLVKKGNSFSVFPLKVLWKEEGAGIQYPVQLAVTVPKRNFNKAVHRNRIKRQIREAYRKNKGKLYEHLGSVSKRINVMVIYSDKEIPVSGTIQKKMAEVLQQLVKRT